MSMTFELTEMIWKRSKLGPTWPDTSKIWYLQVSRFWDTGTRYLYPECLLVYSARNHHGKNMIRYLRLRN